MGGAKPQRAKNDPLVVQRGNSIKGIQVLVESVADRGNIEGYILVV